MRLPRLRDISSELERLLTVDDLPKALFEASSIRSVTVMVAMRDGVRLATDLYLPPNVPASVVVMRTPYGRARDDYLGVYFSFARRGYVVVAQDCRGTGASEPDRWDYYVYESEDGYDLIEWVRAQNWFGGFIGSMGRSYDGQTQWCMATHPAMSTIVPMMSGLGIGLQTARLYMFVNAYARVVGKGEDKVAVSIYEMERVFEEETMADGYFNEPIHQPLAVALLKRFPALQEMPPPEAKRWLWERYCAMHSAQRAEFIKEATGARNVTPEVMESLSSIFGHRVCHDAHTIPNANPSELCRLIRAPPLMITGWYDWFLNDALASWECLRREGRPHVAVRARMIITPYAHNMPGYREGIDAHIELVRGPSLMNLVGVLSLWYSAVREGTVDAWPPVTYYLMGANEWRTACDWPVPEARQLAFYLDGCNALRTEPPRESSEPDRYTYSPDNPTPTVGGSIVSYLYPPGSVDVSRVQQRSDVLVFTTSNFEQHLDVVGPLRMILYASSSAVDTDFVVRLSDVFPDGRAIQIQSGILRARFRNPDGDPELLEPDRIYRFEVDLWATANRFKAGNRLRVDISSADFPHFDRNSNLGGKPGSPVAARQTVYHDPEHPSHLIVHVLEGSEEIEGIGTGGLI